jgi:hypothetical protein
VEHGLGDAVASPRQTFIEIIVRHPKQLNKETLLYPWQRSKPAFFLIFWSKPIALIFGRGFFWVARGSKLRHKRERVKMTRSLWMPAITSGLGQS